MTRNKENRGLPRFGWLESIGQDLWSAARGLRRSPLFGAVVVATLALGIGATSALFAVVDSALLRPLPGRQPERLVWLEESSATHQVSGGTPSRFADWQQSHSLSAMCAYYSDRAIFISENGPVHMRILHTLGDPARTLTPVLIMGRTFTAAENRGAGQPVALITADAWKRDLGADPNILNKTLRLGTAAYQVVGVLSSNGAQFPEDMDVWAPMGADIARAPRQSGFLAQVGRLAPGVSIESAQSEFNLMGGQLARSYPATDAGRSSTLIPLQDFVSQQARLPLLTLLAAAIAVLLVACVNIAGLFTARSLVRQREAAIRISVGAGFLRLARLFFAESLLLATAGCALGLLVAQVGISILKVALPPDIPYLASVSLDWRVAWGAITMAGMSAILFGALPSWQFAAQGQVSALKSTSRSRVRAGLVIAEIALSLMLLVTAGLLANSFFRLRDQPAGFNAANAYSFAVPFGWDSDDSLLNSFATGALSRLTTSPGVMSAGVVDQLPLHGGSQSGSLLVQGKVFDKELADKQFSWRTASAGYFAAAGVPVQRGALYRDWLGGKGSNEALITDRLATLLFPEGNAIGQLISRGSQTPHWFRIVGIVAGIRLNPSDATPEAGVYVPWGATYWPEMKFVVRTTSGLDDFSRLVRHHVQPLTNAQLVEKINTLESLTADTRTSERVRSILLASFAGAALLLSAIGLFGTLSHEVTRRTKDYGVQLALGAQPRLIAWSAVRSALLLAIAGIAIGIAGSVWTSQFLNGMLFGVEPWDITAYASAALILLAMAALAAVIPAARAARIDPIQALRHD